VPDSSANAIEEMLINANAARIAVLLICFASFSLCVGNGRNGALVPLTAKARDKDMLMLI
jgi:hypothetical protein